MVVAVGLAADGQGFAQQRLGPRQIPLGVSHLSEMAEHVGEQWMVVAEPLAANRDGLVERGRGLVETALLPQALGQIVQSHRDVALRRGAEPTPAVDGLPQQRLGFAVACRAHSASDPGR